MDLKKYTKDDLIWIIKRLFTQPIGSIQLSRAVSDLEFEKEKQRLAETDKYAHISDDKRRQCIDLLKRYDGWRLIDIPIDVLKKADRLMREAQDADAKWSKLMGFKP